MTAWLWVTPQVDTWKTWGSLSQSSYQDTRHWLLSWHLGNLYHQGSLSCVEIPQDMLFGNINRPICSWRVCFFYVLCLFALPMFILSMWTYACLRIVENLSLLLMIVNYNLPEKAHYRVVSLCLSVCAFPWANHSFHHKIRSCSLHHVTSPQLYHLLLRGGFLYWQGKGRELRKFPNFRYHKHRLRDQIGQGLSHF